MLGVFGVISNIVQAIEVDHYSHVIGTRQTHQVGADAEGANGCYPGVSKPRHLDPSVALFPRHVGFDLEQYYVADHVPISPLKHPSSRSASGSLPAFLITSFWQEE